MARIARKTKRYPSMERAAGDRARRAISKYQEQDMSRTRADRAAYHER